MRQELKYRRWHFGAIHTAWSICLKYQNCSNR